MGIEEVLNTTGSYVYTNVGTSMMPLLREHRDVMVIRKKDAGKRPRRLDVVLFRRPGRRDYVLHRIMRVNDDGTYWIMGDNCMTGETVAEDNVLGILEAVVRDGKHVPVTSPAFRLYSHLWCDAYPVRVALQRLRRRLRGALRGARG
ncbi:MAG: S24/S26 family peptidase [Atopobiaceae bacterium]|nr:S24/S26 family peptidase [Atopobiaceae bacterium]